ncbi:hypothetical protein RRF57_005968 [Xylaria bambusicola]|uniref:Uncharacterized protein n=1 Tax=Xylaria bambusicola TaxID=326684 RepID=A0AAN7UIN7_9PEZI
MGKSHKSICELTPAQDNENARLPSEEFDAMTLKAPVEGNERVSVKSETSPSSDGVKLESTGDASSVVPESQASSSHGFEHWPVQPIEQAQTLQTLQTFQSSLGRRSFHHREPMLDRMGYHEVPRPEPHSHGDTRIAMHPPPDSFNPSGCNIHLDLVTQGPVGHSDIIDSSNLWSSQEKRAMSLLSMTTQHNDQILMDLRMKVMLVMQANRRYLCPEGWDRAKFQIFDADMKDLEDQITERREELERSGGQKVHALGDYQKQLMLLEKMNKERLACARQKQEEQEKQEGPAKSLL